MFSELIDNLENKKSGEKFHDFCINDAINYIKKAMEAFEASQENPKEWFKDNVSMAKTFLDLFPAIEHTLHTHSLELAEEGNSPKFQTCNL